MKRMRSILALVLSVLMVLTVLSACAKEEDKGTSTDNASAEATEGKITVSWYNGSELLKEEKIDKGGKATTWTPEVDGKEFTGWYSEASLTAAFDFEKALDADTDIFAAFKSNEYVEDKNSYYLVGTGSGDMKASAWDATNANNVLVMTKDASVTDKNVYTIEIAMYAGDRFQVCYGGGWDGQQGIGYMTGCEYADGINPNDNTEYKAEDKKYAEVKDKDGNVVFIGGDEYDKESLVWNAILAEGMDGKYKFTLTTYPANPQYNTLEWTFIEKIEALANTHEMFLIGSFNEWKADDTNYAMTKSEDGATWTAFINVTADQYVKYDDMDTEGLVMKVINHVDGAYYGDAEGKNIVLTEGDYCVQYVTETNEVKVQKLEYYIVGTLLAEDGSSVNFSVKEGVSPKLTVADGVASIDFTAYDATAGAGYDWMAAQGKPGVMAIKVVYGCELGIQNWYDDKDNNGDNWYLDAAEYSVSLDIASGVATVTKK